MESTKTLLLLFLVLGLAMRFPEASADSNSVEEILSKYRNFIFSLLCMKKGIFLRFYLLSQNINTRTVNMLSYCWHVQKTG